jgi:transglutaminase-like putative cysteine protease
MLLKIKHQTQYLFDGPVPYGLQKLRVTPKSRAGQRVVSWSTLVEGGAIELSYTDHHNNQVELVNAEPGTRAISVIASGEVETSNNHGIVGAQGGFVPLWMFLRQTQLTKVGKAITAIAKPIDVSGGALKGLHALSASILKAVPYNTQSEDVTASAEEAFARGYGVCQDHAHIFITACRKLGVPARYVSGYLHIGQGASATASHAWAEAHVPDLGWVGFDVSNGISPDENYVRVATGLDYLGAAPVSGLVFGGHQEKLVVSVEVAQ